MQREYVSLRSPGWILIEHIQGEDRAVALCSIYPTVSRNAVRSLLLLPAIALLVAGCEYDATGLLLTGNWQHASF